MERFSCGVAVISGEDALESLEGNAGQRLMMVTEPHMTDDPLLKMVLAKAKPASAVFFDKVSPEPTVRQALEGARFLQEADPELVVGIGSGNVMNCAKAMVCFAGRKTSLTLIPTEIGSGAETGARVTLFHDRRMHTLRGEKMAPDRVILDGEFLRAEPERKFREGGFALLAAGLESYASKNIGLLGGMYAREAFCTGWAVLPAAVSGRGWARRRIQMASVLASVAADQAGGGLCSALCGSLESIFHIPGGRLAAILLPAVVDFGADRAGTRYAELARCAGMGGSSETAAVRNLRSGLVRLRSELGLPGTLTQAGVPPGKLGSHMAGIVELTLEACRCRDHPVQVDDYVIRRLLDAVAGRN